MRASNLGQAASFGSHIKTGSAINTLFNVGLGRIIMASDFLSNRLYP